MEIGAVSMENWCSLKGILVQFIRGTGAVKKEIDAV